MKKTKTKIYFDLCRSSLRRFRCLCLFILCLRFRRTESARRGTRGCPGGGLDVGRGGVVRGSVVVAGVRVGGERGSSLQGTAAAAEFASNASACILEYHANAVWCCCCCDEEAALGRSAAAVFFFFSREGREFLVKVEVESLNRFSLVSSPKTPLFCEFNLQFPPRAAPHEPEEDACRRKEAEEVVPDELRSSKRERRCCPCRRRRCY